MNRERPLEKSLRSVGLMKKSLVLIVFVLQEKDGVKPIEKMECLAFVIQGPETQADQGNESFPLKKNMQG